MSNGPRTYSRARARDWAELRDLVRMEREATRGLRAMEEDRRKRLRILDACLGCLEEANERDERRVSIAIASRVNPVVPSVIPGMSIRNAIDHVLQEQERHLLAMSDEVTDCYALGSS